jgi:pyruvate, water dikinase
MGRMIDSLKGLWCKWRGEAPCHTDVGELRTLFRARYHNFKLLLNANNKALEIMADLEGALRSSRPIGMSFIKANCTAVSVNVFKMVRNMDELAPGKYEELYARFRDIEGTINQVLSQKRPVVGEELVLSLGDVHAEMADQVGSKMANLGEIRNRIGLPVPAGFVVTSRGYQRFLEANELQAEIERLLQSSSTDELAELYDLSAKIQQLIIRSPVPDDLQEAITGAYRKIEEEVRPGVRVSVRSSALGEDSAGTSFAGQYRSELNVSAEFLLDIYKEIVASKYGLTALSYRRNRGIRDEDIAMCVGCMAMLDAAAGGVMYSRNPMDVRDDAIFINAVWGLPKSVVDGSVDPDLFVVSRSSPPTILKKTIATKDRMFICYPEEGVCRMETTADQGQAPSLSDEQAISLALMATRLEEYYGSPQDIEWAITADGTIYILQARPLQQLERDKASLPEREDRTGDREPALLEGGVTASPGVASGEVYIVRKSMDALRFPEGAVLVATQALPGWAALLHRAAAVVTEHGSITGHLANVAREFGVPGLFGVAGAASSLKPGDLVTVDADGRRIYAGRIEFLLEQSKTPKEPQRESPIHAVLGEVSQHIVPLSLLDPDGQDFKPKKCRTLHDITRFIHEKSVHEMFSFGKEHHFSERSSKQLVCEVPMQWWIINLDDGFREDVDGKYVELSNIVCVPMVALWEGIVAIPWQGPPPVDTKGLMSVLLEATTNPSLDPAMRSKYANRNYFMISKNFCSLTSRFGFHFSTVETLVGERAMENYISFQFKGGAADFQRRLRRAHFVGDILSDYDFRVEVREDAVFARLEGRDQEFMKERLRVLGYLSIHTRQLDMIMSNDAAARSHREKIRKDLSAIVAGGRSEERGGDAVARLH